MSNSQKTPKTSLIKSRATIELVEYETTKGEPFTVINIDGVLSIPVNVYEGSFYPKGTQINGKWFDNFSLYLKTEERQKILKELKEDD